MTISRRDFLLGTTALATAAVLPKAYAEPMSLEDAIREVQKMMDDPAMRLAIKPTKLFLPAA